MQSDAEEAERVFHQWKQQREHQFVISRSHASPQPRHPARSTPPPHLTDQAWKVRTAADGAAVLGAAGGKSPRAETAITS